MPKRHEIFKPFIVSKLSEEGHDFLSKCFQIDPSKRWTASQLLSHRYFDEISSEFPKELQYILECDKKENKLSHNNSKGKVDIVFSPKKEKSSIFSELKAKKINIFLNKSFVTRKSPHRKIMKNAINLNKKRIMQNSFGGDRKNLKNIQRNIGNNEFQNKLLTKRKNQISFFLHKELSKILMDDHNFIPKNNMMNFNFNSKFSNDMKPKLIESDNSNKKLNNINLSVSPDEKELSLTRSNKYFINNFFLGKFKNYNFQNSNSKNIKQLTKEDSLITNYNPISYSRYNLNCGIESTDSEKQYNIKSSFENEK